MTEIADWRDRATLTVPEVAGIIHLGRSATYAAVAAGEVPSVKVGRRLLVPTARLRRWLGELPSNDHDRGAQATVAVKTGVGAPDATAY